MGILAVVLISGVAYVQLAQPSTKESYQVPQPEEIVRQYFESWNRNDWPNMYAAVSDGFKRIDPDAKSLSSFRDFAGSQGVEGVSIISVKEISNDGTTASVDYSVEFVSAGGSKRKSGGTFTLKFRQGDVIPGWKLIRPYGNNADAS